MQIELIGCTNSGKSTLSRILIHTCRERGVDILLGDEFILKQVRLNWIKNYLLRKLFIDLVALFACLLTWRSNVKFYLFAIRHLLWLPIAMSEKIHVLRVALKKIGSFEIIRFYSSNQQVILVDEGVLQAAHNLFVFVSVNIRTKHLSTFLNLIPLPDVLFYLKQPEGLLISRTIKKGHKRIPDRSYGNVAQFVKQAVATFDKLVQQPDVEKKLVVVGDGEEVIRATNDKDDPILGLFQKIIERGYKSTINNLPNGSKIAPGPFNATPLDIS